MTRITRGLLLCLALLARRGALAQPDGMLAGNLSSVGSDTLANLMALWAQDFSRHYPNVNLQIQAADSSTAPTVLAAGAAQLGPMSLPMKAAEVSAFEHRYGYAPLAVDALVVLVCIRTTRCAASICSSSIAFSPPPGAAVKANR